VETEACVREGSGTPSIAPERYDEGVPRGLQVGMRAASSQT
jgi:hypothetical protein